MEVSGSGLTQHVFKTLEAPCKYLITGRFKVLKQLVCQLVDRANTYRSLNCASRLLANASIPSF